MLAVGLRRLAPLPGDLTRALVDGRRAAGSALASASTSPTNGRCTVPRRPSVTRLTIEQFGQTQTVTVTWERGRPGLLGRLLGSGASVVALRPSGTSEPWSEYPVPSGTRLVSRLRGPRHTAVGHYDARVRRASAPDGWSPTVTARVTVLDGASSPAGLLGAAAVDEVGDRIHAAARIRGTAPDRPSSVATSPTPLDAAGRSDTARTEALTDVLRVLLALESRLGAGTAAALRDAATFRR